MLKPTSKAKPKPARITLTKAAIEKLKPPATDRTYTFDAREPGFCLCTTAAGSKAFYWYRKVNGKPERNRLGAWPELTVDQARGLAEKHNGGKADGKNPAEKRRDARNAPTLGEVFEVFIDLPTRTKAKRPRSEKTKHDYRYQYDRFLAEWKDRQVSTITRTEVERLHNRIGEENGIYLANRRLALLKAIFNAAIDGELYNANPVSRLRPFEEESRERHLHRDEFQAFWESLEAEPSEKVRDFVKLALFTGQRRGNVAEMRWDEVNLDRAVWSIPQTKTGKHVVPLTSQALEVLRRRLTQRGESEFVFPGRHGREHLKDPNRQWHNILKDRGGIENLRVHDLRRTLGSWQTADGASLTIVGKTMGHSRPETTAIYARLELGPVRDSMESATGAMMAAATPKEKAKAKPKSKATKSAGKARKVKGANHAK